MVALLSLLALLFVVLAFDALRSHGVRSAAFRPDEDKAAGPDLAAKALIKRSGRSVATVFLLLAGACTLAAVLIANSE